MTSRIHRTCELLSTIDLRLACSADRVEIRFDKEYFLQDPSCFFSFAHSIFPSNFVPSPSHRFIKLLEEKKKLLRNYTQNIDTLEEAAGVGRARTQSARSDRPRLTTSLYSRSKVFSIATAASPRHNAQLPGVGGECPGQPSKTTSLRTMSRPARTVLQERKPRSYSEQRRRRAREARCGMTTMMTMTTTPFLVWVS